MGCLQQNALSLQTSKPSVETFWEKTQTHAREEQPLLLCDQIHAETFFFNIQSKCSRQVKSLFCPNLSQLLKVPLE